METSLDRLARMLDYGPETKLLVVGEENVLANPKEPNIGDHHVIRVFAKALYHVTAARARGSELGKPRAQCSTVRASRAAAR